MAEAQAFVPEDDNKTWLVEASKDFKRLQKQKSRSKGGVEARVLQARGFKWGEQYISQRDRGIVAEVREDNRLHLVFNLVDQACLS